MFNDNEHTYLASQRLARLATVSPDGQPEADAVGFEFADGRFWIGGHALATTRKYRNVTAGSANVSLIVDDLASVEPWMPRGIKVNGVAEIVRRTGMFGEGEYVAITPRVSWSWGLDGAPFGNDFQGGRFAPRKILWEPLTEFPRSSS